MVTFEVSKFDISKFTKFVHPENALFIILISGVLKFDRFNVVIDDKLLNILSIFLNFKVLKDDKSKDFNSLHPVNRLII